MKRFRLGSAVVLALLAASFAASGESARFAPELHGERWLNSEPLQMDALRGKVVLVEFWTFACWNCQNVEPYVKRWHARYQADGLTVIGVHCPEFDRERELANLRRYMREHAIAYPVLVDNAFRTWRAYGNRYWPALYLVDKRGRIRHVAIGEGGYAETESKIRALLAESS
ncbi:MAG TPA: redoxin domain-containing protein [Myxococcota bacterium]|nr:redoxin domain-containing protein [Myxococcota bacterium]